MNPYEIQRRKADLVLTPMELSPGEELLLALMFGPSLILLAVIVCLAGG